MVGFNISIEAPVHLRYQAPVWASGGSPHVAGSHRAPAILAPPRVYLYCGDGGSAEGGGESERERGNGKGEGGTGANNRALSSSSFSAACSCSGVARSIDSPAPHALARRPLVFQPWWEDRTRAGDEKRGDKVEVDAVGGNHAGGRMPLWGGLAREALPQSRRWGHFGPISGACAAECAGQQQQGRDRSSETGVETDRWVRVSLVAASSDHVSSGGVEAHDGSNNDRNDDIGRGDTSSDKITRGDGSASLLSVSSLCRGGAYGSGALCFEVPVGAREDQWAVSLVTLCCTVVGAVLLVWVTATSETVAVVEEGGNKKKRI